MIEPPMGLNEADFETIEAAVMETARGRWFLAEYARRCRAEDTARILGAVDRLENAAVAARAEEASARLNADRAAALVRQLADIVRAAQGGALARAELSIAPADKEPPALSPPSEAPPATVAKGLIEARLEALASLEGLPPAPLHEGPDRLIEDRRESGARFRLEFQNLKIPVQSSTNRSR